MNNALNFWKTQEVDPVRAAKLAKIRALRGEDVSPSPSPSPSLAGTPALGTPAGSTISRPKEIVSSSASCPENEATETEPQPTVQISQSDSFVNPNEIESPPVLLEATLTLPPPEDQVETLKAQIERLKTERQQLEENNRNLQQQLKSLEEKSSTAPPVQVESPSIQVEVPSVQVEDSSVQVEAPSVQVEAPSVQVEAPSVQEKS
eukprot:TRINITY_DN1259_c0_g1_i7.p1 TRINITY_DN1259_c0_g1~~TRINITY_DN1259_c0_g1_i7.p1  ORF type:complete len:205 (+),score=74.68 TRINITY_DN1259_c0_g1_i7:198-812(+)